MFLPYDVLTGAYMLVYTGEQEQEHDWRIMGTNFYAEVKQPCKCCGRPYDSKHIGKSSAGWCFSLRVYPDEGINTLHDWIEYLDGKNIKDEYGIEITLDDLVDRITKRSHPIGLSRHEIDNHFCVGRGDGTFDYIVGDFS